MFTRIRLQNFRSFGDITLDLTEKNGDPKNIAVIYGENGAGKSNIASAFVLLDELLSTMNVRDMYEELLSQKAIFTDESMESMLRQRIKSGMRDMRAIIDDYRMVGSDEHIIIEYEFQILGKPGKYCVVFGQDEIIYEKLEYLLNKRKGTYFECSESDIYINSNVIKSKDLLRDIKDSAKRFWGKHSILSIIVYELFDKSRSYALDNITDNFNEVINLLGSVSCYVKIGVRRWDKLKSHIDILESADEGSIPSSKESQLSVAESIFTKFFSSINSDIQKAYYRRTYNDKFANYELVLEKLIAGQYRQIDFSRESTGNHQVLRALCYLLTACSGGVAVIDEADSAIHDYLFKKIFNEVEPFISGQVIMTTHNTMLMEADFARSATYILSEEESGNRVVKAISDYDRRTYLGNNIRNKYLNNEYGGLPQVHKIEFEELIQELRNNIDNSQD